MIFLIFFVSKYLDPYENLKKEKNSRVFQVVELETAEFNGYVS